MRPFAHEIAFFPAPDNSFDGNPSAQAGSQSSSASEGSASMSSQSTSSGFQGSLSKSSPEFIGCDLPSAAPESEFENIVMDHEQGILFLTLFGNLCPALAFCYEGCSNVKCISSLHQLPSVEVVEKKLNSSSKTDVENFLALVREFMPEVRARYLSAFAKVYATRNELDKLKNLINICQKSSQTVACLDYVVDALIRKGWEVADAIQFLIENHKDSKAARPIIMAIIRGTNDDSKFAEYIAKGIKVEKDP
jgi:hypothetical protein